MQSIRPSQLTNEELLRYVYMSLGISEKPTLPVEWVQEMCTRMAQLIDANAELHQLGYKEGSEDGFEEGFEAGVNYANDPEMK